MRGSRRRPEGRGWASLALSSLALSSLGLSTLVGCVGADESDAWRDEERSEAPAPRWEGRGKSRSGEKSREDKVSQERGRSARRVASGSGWEVSASGGRPVETFASAEGPVGFAPADPAEPEVAPPPPSDPSVGPWLEVPTQAAAPGEPEGPRRTPLRLRAEGVELVSGRCGPVPVARYGLDWRPEREWRLGQDEDPEPWLRPVDPPPLPPLEAEAEPELKEAGPPVGSWIEAR